MILLLVIRTFYVKDIKKITLIDTFLPGVM
jgi:hypothetical protein